MSERRRLLIISTTFYPDPQVAAIRMTQWSRHLPEHGWQVHVLCRHYGYECSPAELARAVHPEVTVEYLDQPAAAPGMLERGGGLRAWFRNLGQWLLRFRSLATLIVPDPSIRFWRQQRQHILKRVQEIRPEVILTSSPPHSNHDIGLWLAAQTGIPWVADFRDPYLLDSRFRPVGLGLLRWWAHQRYREVIFDRAWLVTFAIPAQARWTRRSKPEMRTRMLTLTNAFPTELAAASDEMAAGFRPGPKTMLVAGTIPEPEQCVLAQAVARLVSQGHDLQLQLIGRRPACAEVLRGFLRDRLLLPDYLSHAETIQAMTRADVLVSYLNEERSRTLLLSTKLFEYLATGKPVVCINPSRSDRHLLRGRSGLAVLEQPALEEIATVLENALSGRWNRNPAEVARFRQEHHWPQRVARLAVVLEQLVAFPPKTAPAPAGTSVKPVATVVITTKNRQESIRLPVLAALHQSVPVEVIVVDDGSTDGTASIIRDEFPQVRLIRHEDSRGYITRRNEAALAASTNVIFSIDDDAQFSSASVVAQTMAAFDHPRVGAVAIPCVDVRKSQGLRQPSARRGACSVTDAFIGTAHAVRRDVFLLAGGYRENLIHQGEESDFCLRMLNLGWVVRLGSGAPIWHFESPNRDYWRMDYFGRRNDVLFAWHNVPGRYLLQHLAATTFNGVCAGITSRHLPRMLRGTLVGYADCLAGRLKREPVDIGIYRLQRRLKKHGPLSLQDIESHLPPLKTGFGA